MIEYTDKQKRDAVKAYRKGRGGLLATTAAAQGVNADKQTALARHPEAVRVPGSMMSRY